MEAYDRVAKVVAPKKAKLAEAEAEFSELMVGLNAKKAELKEVEDRLAVLNAKLADMQVLVESGACSLFQLSGRVQGKSHAWHRAALCARQGRAEQATAWDVMAYVLALAVAVVGACAALPPRVHTPLSIPHTAGPEAAARVRRRPVREEAQSRDATDRRAGRREDPVDGGCRTPRRGLRQPHGRRAAGVGIHSVPRRVHQPVQ
eukprot:365382-Chlamydomonas_euryale.AAC.1